MIRSLHNGFVLIVGDYENVAHIVGSYVSNTECVQDE